MADLIFVRIVRKLHLWTLWSLVNHWCTNRLVTPGLREEPKEILIGNFDLRIYCEKHACFRQIRQQDDCWNVWIPQIAYPETEGEAETGWVVWHALLDWRRLTSDYHFSTEQEQDAAMERHRREQELKRKRDALSLGEVREQLLHLDKKLKSLKDEKNELFLQLKRVLNEDEKRKKQREAEILAAHQQAIQNAQQNQLNAVQLPPQTAFTGYPYIDSRSLITAVRPTPSHAQPDPYPRIPVSTTAPSQSSNILSISGNGSGIVGQATNKNTQVVKRRHEGSPSPTPPQRIQTAAPGNKTNVLHPSPQSIPSKLLVSEWSRLKLTLQFNRNNVRIPLLLWGCWADSSGIRFKR